MYVRISRARFSAPPPACVASLAWPGGARLGRCASSPSHCGEALVRLRAYAFAHDRPIVELAQEVVAGGLCGGRLTLWGGR